MKNIKIFAFLAVFLLSAAVSTAWAKDVTLTYKISVTGTIPHAYITNADGKTVCDWRNGIKTLWPANEEHSMNDGYGITFTPDQDLDKTDKNENKKSTSTTAFRTEENTIFTVSVGQGFYFKSVTFKEDGTEKASSSNIAPNSTSISVSVPKNKFFNYITVVLTNDFHYIDENGKEQIRKSGEYTVLTSLTDVSNLGGGWYVVQGEVKYTSQVTFNGEAHLILADGAEMTIESESMYGIYALNNLTIYRQSGQGGILNATANGTGGYGISSLGDITISGGTVTASGSLGYGIRCSNGVTISGGTVTATGYYGIYSRGNITLGWTNSTDFIKASGYYSVNGTVSIAEGKSFKDDKDNVYSGTLTGEQLSAIEGKKLEPCYAVALDLQDGKAPVMLPATFDENGVAHVAKPNDPIRSGFTFEGWFTATDGNTEFDFTKAVTGNTTAYAHWNENTPVEYIDENGAPKSVTDFIVLTEDNKPNENGVINLPGGWYVVEGKVKYTNQVEFSGDAHLILADGATMVIESEKQSEYVINAKGNLSIYGQSGQKGTLEVTATGDYSDGIYSSEGNITISGGKVTATGDNNGIFGYKGVSISGGSVTATGLKRGIYGYEGVTIIGGTVTATGEYGDGIFSISGDITISGGKVTATGDNNGIFGYKGVSISGGSVTATGKNSYGIYGYKEVTISGGMVEATSKSGDGIYSEKGNITLGWTNSTDSIKASSYYGKNGVSIAEGKSFKDDKGKAYRGTLTGEQLSAIKGNRLEPCYAVALDLQDGKAPVMLPATFDENGVAHVAKPNDPIRSGFTFEGWFTATDGNTEFDFTKAVTGNTTAYAHWKKNTPVEYIDENGETQILEPGDYTVLTENTNVGNLPEGWYVVQGKVKYSNQVKFEDDAHLILADGAEMVIETKGKSEHGIYASNNLTIYGQNGQRGILNDTANGTNGIGIYSEKGNITINGGTVTATGKSGPGIYSRGNITISGGSVTASGSSYGIRGSNGVTISGGTVTAIGVGYNGIFSVFGDITLGWTNSTDSIKASSYSSYYGAVKIAEGKSFKDEDGNVYRGTLTGEQLSAIKSKKLEPCYAVTFDAQNGDDPIMLLTTFDENGVAHVEKPNDPIRSGFTFEGWFTATDGNTEFDFSAAITGNTTAYAKWSVPYIDEKGAPKSVTDYTVLTSLTDVSNLGGGWYVVQGEVKYTRQVKFSGEAHLILADGAEMTIESKTYGIQADTNLTIYGQNEQRGILNATSTLSSDSSQTYDAIYSRNGSITIIGGSVTATGDNSGICSYKEVTIIGGTVAATGKNDYGIYSRNGSITISGGTVEATGEDFGIYGNNGVTIIGGSVTATSKNGYGIYGDNGVTIIDGSVEATGDYGIYSSEGNITISGGSVAATGGYDGIYSNSGHITLGWTNSTDFIKVSSIHLGADSCTVSIAKGKSFVDENGNEYRDTLTDENLESIKNKTLTPLMPFPDNIVIANISGATYTGDSIRLKPVVTIGENDTLELGKDYTLAYKDNLNASNTAKVIVKGAGKYYGEVQKSFTIDKAPLKITALNDTIVYGDEPANQGVAYDGFVGNETSEVLKGELALEIGYKRYDDAGKYAITPSGLNADNYKIEFVAGTLTVEPKVISIVWGEQTVFAYDGEAHAPNAAAEGLVNNDECNLVIDSATEVGNHIAKVTGLSNKNYKLPATGLEKEFKIVMPIAYIDENGVEQTVTNYTVLTSDVAQTDENGVITLPAGWYVVQENVVFANRIAFAANDAGSKDVHLILADDAKMKVETEFSYAIGDSTFSTLTIYGQKNQSGVLEVSSEFRTGIYSYKGSIAIVGGHVNVNGENGIEANHVTIAGGNVEAKGDCYGISSVDGITLSWMNSTDAVKASSYYSVNGSVSIAKDKYFKDEKGKEYSGTIDDVSDIAGKTLVPSFNGKFLSDVNIAVADIPVQKYADGKPVCPSVVVTDGKDTLKAGTDYTVACFNNNAVTSATLDEAAIAQITGKGNYAGAIQKRFFIWNNIRDYAAVQVFEDADGKTHAEIDGAYDGTDAVAIDEDVENVTVKFNREFSVNLENGGFSTIMLPFDVKASSLTGVKSIFKFAEVFDKNVGVNYVWCNATIGKQEFEKGHPNCNELSGELKAYTPYMVEMETPTLGINGKVTLLKSSNNATNSVVRKGNWVFRGVLQKKEWSKEDEDIQKGIIWAFAGSARNGASIGKFVQFGGNNWVNPFRAYLVDCTTYPDASECKDDETQPEPSLVSRYRFADVLAPATSAENSLSAKTPMGVAGSETALLNSMDIVIVYGDSASGERPTVIGRMNPATGEIRMLPRTKQTYDLKGRRVGNGKKAKGAYYNRR